MMTMIDPEAIQRRRVLVLSTTAFTLLFAVWLMFGILMLKIAPEFNLTIDQKGWLLATAILAGSLLRLHFGIWADRYGGRLLMIGLLLFTAIPCYFVSRCHTYEELLICAALFGVAGNAFSVGVSWNSAWFTDKSKGTALGVFGAGNVGASLTKFLAPTLLPLLPVSGLLGGLIPGGWRCIPVIYSLMLVGMAFLVWKLAPTPDRKPGKGRSTRDMFAPLKHIRVWRFSLYYVVVFGAYLALAGWLPSYFKETFKVSDAMAGYLTALYIFPASLLRPLGGYLADRFGPRPVTYTVFVSLTALLTLLCLPSNLLPLNLAAFTLLIFLVGCAMGIGKASVFKYIPDYFPKDVGAVGGMVGLLGALGGFYLPVLFGKLGQWTHSPQSAFLSILLLTLICLGWLHKVVWRLKANEKVAVPVTNNEVAPVPTS